MQIVLVLNRRYIKPHCWTARHFQAQGRPRSSHHSSVSGSTALDSYSKLYELLAKGEKPLADKEGTKWRQGQHWVKRWSTMMMAFKEMIARSRIDNAANGIHHTPSKAAAAISAERETRGIGFSTHYKDTSKRLQALLNSQ